MFILILDIIALVADGIMAIVDSKKLVADIKTYKKKEMINKSPIKRGFLIFIKKYVIIFI